MPYGIDDSDNYTRCICGQLVCCYHQECLSLLGPKAYRSLQRPIWYNKLSDSEKHQIDVDLEIDDWNGNLDE